MEWQDEIIDDTQEGTPEEPKPTEEKEEKGTDKVKEPLEEEALFEEGVDEVEDIPKGEEDSYGL